MLLTRFVAFAAFAVLALNVHKAEAKTLPCVAFDSSRWEHSHPTEGQDLSACTGNTRKEAKRDFFRYRHYRLTSTTKCGSGKYAYSPIPCSLVQCESRNSYHALNSSSGAGGRYQVIPSTWRAYGGHGLPQNASPEEQSRVAAAVLHGQGPSAWSCW